MRYFCDRLTTWLDGFVEGMGGGYVECGHLGGHAPLLVAIPTLNDTDLPYSYPRAVLAVAAGLLARDRADDDPR